MNKRIPASFMILLMTACGGLEGAPEVGETASGLTPLVPTGCSYDTSNPAAPDGVGNQKSCATPIAGTTTGNLSSSNDIDWYYAGFDASAPNAEFAVGPANVAIKCELWTQTGLSKAAGAKALPGQICTIDFAAAAGSYYFLKVYTDSKLDASQFIGTFHVSLATQYNSNDVIPPGPSLGE